MIEYSNILKHGSGAKGIGCSEGINETEAGKEYKNILSRHCNSLEKVLMHVLGFLMRMTLVGRH